MNADELGTVFGLLGQHIPAAPMSTGFLPSYEESVRDQFDNTKAVILAKEWQQNEQPPNAPLLGFPALTLCIDVSHRAQSFAHTHKAQLEALERAEGNEACVHPTQDIIYNCADLYDRLVPLKRRLQAVEDELTPQALRNFQMAFEPIATRALALYASLLVSIEPNRKDVLSQSWKFSPKILDRQHKKRLNGFLEVMDAEAFRE